MARVLMAGGLGNQLFQFSAAKLVAQLEVPELVYGVYPTRKLEDGNEIFNSKERFGVRISDADGYPLSLRKVLNFSLRRSSKVTKYHLDKELLQILLTVLTKLMCGRSERYFINNGVGWDERINSVGYKTTLIGYFQSYNVGLAGSKVLKEIIDRIPMPEDILDQSEDVMIHIRLTDYLGSDSLGHLENSYYMKALSKLEVTESKQYKIFTDGTSKEIFRRFKFADTSRIVETSNLNSWQILKSMSNSKHFIIANSSFSWWSAQLNVNKSKHVVSPETWFVEDSPRGIHDPSWILI